jgi:prepilin-type N-terminal cleavage/methylation domain-containing protein
MEYSEQRTILRALIIRLVVTISRWLQAEKGDVEMKIIAKQFSRRPGFTIVEMLTAIAIIAVLVSLIIPALSMVHKAADKARQRAQFHSIELGLEAFRADFGDYPESIDNRDKPGGGEPDAYCGAQKLAEAMIGLDGFGFHPMSEFRKDGLADWDRDGSYTTTVPDESVYHVGRLTEFESSEENLIARKGPYLELETANAVKIKDLYDVTKLFPNLGNNTFVLADMFGLVKHRSTGKKTGTPILYFRANAGRFEHDETRINDGVNIYEFNDNEVLIDWPTPNWTSHKMTPEIFYSDTLNPNFPDPPRPYRSESFILLSAGPDGRYGTSDDVYNFDSGT